MLTDKIHVECPGKDDQEPEDILSSSLTHLFPDDTRNQHGDPDAVITYASSRFGNIKLTVADPAGENNRRLFAHYLWNAAVWLAEAVSEPSSNEHCEKNGKGRRAFDMNGERVLELGAGLGLGGIVSAMAGAEEVILSDYPAPEILANLQHNIDANFDSTPDVRKPRIQGHEWGSTADDLSSANKHRFTRILAADCLWMPWEHSNLVRSMSHFLSTDDESGRVIVVGGFHTGRQKVAPFFDVLREEALEVESIEEVDVEGNKRPWMRERDGGREDVTARKRWLVVAVLKRGTAKATP